MPLSTEQLYLAIVTITSSLTLPQPTFGYTLVSSPPAYGNVFSALSSTNHAIVFNTFAAGMFALYKGKAATTFLHAHVVLFALTYLALLLLNFIMWEEQRFTWSALQEMTNLEIETDLKGPPEGLIASVIVPIVLFNFVLLPLYVWQASMPSGCVKITVTEAS